MTRAPRGPCPNWNARGPFIRRIRTGGVRTAPVRVHPDTPGCGRLRRLDTARRRGRTGTRAVPAPARLRRVEAHRDAPAPPADHRRRVRHLPLRDQLDAVRPAAGRPALPARRGRPLRQPHPPAARRGRGARPAEPPPPPADPPPVGGQGRDAEPPRRVPARALPLRRRARAARARARANHRASGGTVLLLRGAPREPCRADAGRGPLHPVVALPRRQPREPGRRARALQRAEARLPRRGGARRPLARPDAIRIARGRRALRTSSTAWTPRLSYGPT